MTRFSALVTLCFFPLLSAANEVDVINAEAINTGENTFHFNVTLKHQDTGWQHYANKWQILSPTGELLGTRVLFHPHENEQPFTRGLSGVVIPKNIRTVIIRGYDSVHETGGQEFQLTLPGN
jgi:hypothetical protein